MLYYLSGGFQEVTNLSNCLHSIHEHFENEYPKEGCGILGISKGKLHWVPCENKASADEEFVISSREFFKAKQKFDIVGIVHSHPDGEATPSEHDIDCCNALGIPYYVFSFPEMELVVVEPKSRNNLLSGREYQFGINDCFEAARDYYASIGINLPHRDLYEDDWWKKGLDYFTEEYIETWGFKKVSDPQPNDLLIFSVTTDVGNHCGVYLGNDLMFHHAEKRLSCKENLYPFWVQHLTGIYRYES